MKNSIFFIFMLTSLSFFYSCSSDSDTAPTVSADFSFANGNCIASCDVTFTNNSSNATSYAWEFGDGAISSSANPTHTYTLDGNYTVRLTATNGSATNTISKTVTIGAPTQARITSVTITAMSFVDGNGAGWDISSGPDVFFKVLGPNPNNTVLFDADDDAIDNISPSDLPLGWTLTNPFLIPTNNDFYFIALYDDDTVVDPDDLIAGISFKLNDYITGPNRYPTEITKTQQGATVRIGLAWE